MAEEKFGTETIETVLFALGDLGKEVSVALEDGKFSGSEGIGLIDNVLQIPGIAEKWGDFKDEVGDMSLEERGAVVTKFAARFDISNDVAEERIEACLDLGTSIVRTYFVFSKKPAA